MRTVTSTEADPGKRPGALATALALRHAEARLAWPSDEVRRYQLRHLQSVLARAKDDVPFYRDRHAGVPKIASLEDIAHLPIIDRRELASVQIDARRGAPTTARTLTKHTSGTTGHYLSVELSARAAWLQGVLEVRRNRVRGLQPWHRTAAIRTAPDTRPRVGVLGAVARMHTVLDAADDPASLAGSLLAVRPVAISGFGHLLLDVAEHVAGGLRPKVLGTGGQVLSPSDRQALTEAFGTQPLDLYGSVEVGSIAWQCASADLYHLEHDSVLVELLDEDGAPVLPGEVGEVILTSLQNPHMPFVRYRVGDRARLADRPCRCGDALPALLAIEGREMDRFVDERGETVASSRLFLSGQMEDDLRWVRRYRVRQDSDRRVTVELVTTGPLPDHVVARIIDGYRSVLGGTSAVTIAVVDDIPLEASGKLRQFTSCATLAPPAGG